jgi:hypothetical protein
LKHDKHPNHLSAAEGSDLHLLRQVIPHPLRTDNGKTQLGAPGLQKGELLKVLPAPLLRHLPLMLIISRHIIQATRFLLGHLSNPVRIHKLILEEGYLLEKAFCIFTSRG